ncbi:MAG: hypothetical protein ACE37D_20820 [Pseudomonadales bacterium]
MTHSNESRRICEPCPVDTITQGSIFNYASNEDFRSGDDMGMLISARCDIANAKSEKFSYLPVIHLKKYIQFFLVPKLLQEQFKENINTIKNLVQNEGGSRDTVDLYGAVKSIDVLIKKEKPRQKAEEILKSNQKIEQIQKKEWHQLDSKDYSVIPKKKFRQELDSLVNNKVEGVFFIDEVIDFNNLNETLGPVVVLLREVHHMNMAFSELIRKGCDHDELIQTENRSHPIDLAPGRMSYILCNISSPYIELIMQRFSNLYTRIGVKDPSPKLVDNFFSTHFSE